jgi:hypothetical protein
VAREPTPARRAVSGPVRCGGRILRAGLIWGGGLICCCAGPAACAAAAPAGPVAAVTAPSLSRPPAPASAQAALSAEAFTPYAGLGASTDDGLAPGDTYAALHAACMAAAGYGQYASATPFSVRENRGLAFAQPFGPWGYLGTALAARQGFAETAADGEVDQPAPAASLPAGAQSAAGKCVNIVGDFNDAQFATALAGIETMNDDISTDVVQDPDFRRATREWSACMARNGYSSAEPETLAQQQQGGLAPAQPGPGQGPPPAPAAPPATQSPAQLAAAVTDAECTQDTDLAGIYFAAQASYEQQFVDANQQALNDAVRRYKAAFAAELRKLPALLRTTPATPQLPHGPAHPGRPPGS